MTRCAFSHWFYLPLDLRRRLRALAMHQVGLAGVTDRKGRPYHPQPLDVLAARLAHLSDGPPRCSVCRAAQEDAA